MQTFTAEPVVQGRDPIIIDAPTERVWPLIADSMLPERWGPPVEEVEVSLLDGQHAEGVRSTRKGRRQVQREASRLVSRGAYRARGWAQHHLSDLGRQLWDGPDVHRRRCDHGNRTSERQTKFTFSFYKRPTNLMGRIMNRVIRADQRRNRRRALQSIKQFVETGVAIKN